MLSAPPDTASTTPDPAANQPLPPRADIVLDHVTFGYEPAHPILRDLSIVIRPGERVAFVADQ